MALKFGDLESKSAAQAFARRSAKRTRIAGNVVDYYLRYVQPKDWPTECAPLTFFPKSFQRVPLSTLHDAARTLQARRATVPPETRQ